MAMALAHLTRAISPDGNLIGSDVGFSGMQQQSRVYFPRRNSPLPCSRLSFIRAHRKPIQNEKDALNDPQVNASRDSMEDTLGNDANQMLGSFVGDGKEQHAQSEKDPLEDAQVNASMKDTVGKENAVGNTVEGKVGADAFEREERGEVDDIEQQYLSKDDKLTSSNEGEEQDASNTNKGEKAPVTGNIHPARDWRVWAEGRQVATHTEEYETKQLLGWSESKCDEDSILDSHEPSSGNGIEERLVRLEDFVMKRDDGKSAADYSRRAGIFEKSAEVLKAKKAEDDGVLL